jgi:outer membrane biosynthesis protein TonB
MKKYIVAFFTFLGYVFSIFLLGAGIVIYIGHRKSQSAKDAVMSSADGQVVRMSPEKQADSTTTLLQTIPDIQPISHAPVSAPAKAKTVRAKPDKKPAKSAKPAQAPKPTPKPELATKPVAYAKPVSKPKQAKPKRTRQAAPIAYADAAPKPELGTSILRYQVTDRAGRERTGHGVVNMDATSDLEKAAIRRAKAINELAAAADKIRNPQ